MTGCGKTVARVRISGADRGALGRSVGAAARWRAFCGVVVTLAVSATGCETAPPDAPATAPAPATGAAPAGGVTAAALHAETSCSTIKLRTGVAKLTWTPASDAQQRVELTIVRTGFDQGVFDTSPTLKAGAATFQWEPLQGQAFHFWRVSSLRGGQWVPSEVASFEGPTCAFDGER